MHGMHDIHEEYKGNAQRLGPPVRSVESFRFARSKGRAVSSNVGMWTVLKEFIKRSLVLGLFITGFWMIFVGLGWDKRMKSDFKSIKAVLSLAHPLSKRSEIHDLPVEKELNTKISSVNEQLKMLVYLLPDSFNSTMLTEAISTIKDSSANVKLVKISDDTGPSVSLNGTFLPDTIYHETNSTSIFEAITFAWCRIFKEQKQFPGKVTIFAAKSDELCLKRTLKRALKLKDDQVTIKTTDEPSRFSCSTNQDLFDCANSERLRVRYLKSRHCPELAPILLACRNEITLDRAKSFIPQISSSNQE